MPWRKINLLLTDQERTTLEQSTTDTASLKAHLLGLSPIQCLCELSEVAGNEVINHEPGHERSDVSWKVFIHVVFILIKLETDSKIYPLSYAMTHDPEIISHIRKVVDSKFPDPNYNMDIASWYFALTDPIEEN